MITTANVPHDDELDVPYFETPVFDHVKFASTKFNICTRFNENQINSVFNKQNLVATTWNER